MKEQLRVFLHALQQHQHEIVMSYFFLSIMSWAYWAEIRSATLSAVLINTLATLSAFAVLAYTISITFYLLYPNYLDHIQATVASISWLGMHGHELYPNWTTGEIYGLVYGPVLFLMNGMALLLSASIFASKLPGVLSFGAALGATWMLLTWKTTNNLTSLFLLASLIMLYSVFHEFAYWNRAEPFLILLSVVALLLAFRSSLLVAGIGIGVLAGLATALKIHGFIYTVPAAAAALARAETPRGRVVMIITGSACAAACALVPYLEKGVSLTGYLQFLRVTFDSGFAVSLFIENFLFAVILAAPIIVIWVGWKPALNLPDRWLLAALGPSIALITVIGASQGAGPYHLLPLIPVCVYAIAVVCRSSKIEASKAASLIFVSYFLAYSPNLFLNIGYWYKNSDPTPELQKIAELKSFLDTYPEAQIGISDDDHYPSYFYRVFSVWNGRPLDIDFTVWMDLAYAGVEEKHIMRLIRGCAVATWILPLGTPFIMSNWYNYLPLLSESFRVAFSTNYRQVETGHTYQVWQCKS